MHKKGVALVEIVVSMIILAVAALAVTATVSMVNGKEMRSAGGSSLDLQALSFARQTLESLKNAVSTDGTRATPLVVSPTSYDVSDGLPAGFTRKYKVSSVTGTDLKKVTVCVAWSPDTCT